MSEKRETGGGRCCGARGMRRRGSRGGLGCCRVEAIVSVDERGQVVLPKEVRERAGIGAGEKLAVIFHGGGGADEKACCLTLMKTEGLADGVRAMLGPLMRDLFDLNPKE